jgi:AAA+ superfamily predicted ATPase
VEAGVTPTTPSGLFEQIQTLPDKVARRRYEDLVGLDNIKGRLEKEARLLLDPTLLETWSKKHHGGKVIAATDAFRERIPLFLFAGDVGTGKTALAETFGDRVARELKVEVLLMRLSLRARGAGSVGEMTQLISSAFDYVQTEIPVPKHGRRPEHAAVLLIDEADALAQSRELAQMHHEDRAGVNALIRGIDGIAQQRRPVITVMCSNRLSALDPAIQRRAADIFTFDRPDDEQRAVLLGRGFRDAGLTEQEIRELARLTGDANGLGYGYTFSDLTTRLIPNTVLDALPDRPLAFERISRLAAETQPTAPFSQEIAR